MTTEVEKGHLGHRHIQFFRRKREQSVSTVRLSNKQAMPERPHAELKYIGPEQHLFHKIFDIRLFVPKFSQSVTQRVRMLPSCDCYD
jgi:hypothetical protein